MYENCQVELEMKKMLLTDGILEPKIFHGHVWRYGKEEECLYLQLEDENLSAISLDAVYECRVQEGRQMFTATGKVRERYCNEAGEILEFRIQNGFYKNNIKSVDKLEME